MVQVSTMHFFAVVVSFRLVAFLHITPFGGGAVL